MKDKVKICPNWKSALVKLKKEFGTNLLAKRGEVGQICLSVKAVLADLPSLREEVTHTIMLYAALADFFC